MRKATLLATALIFAGAQFAVAMPASLGAGQSLTQSSDGMVTLVASDKKKGKKAKKSSKSSGGMNMQNMPPGHKM
ncbi:MAG: hypothetical protein K2Y56_18900 [Methylobacterium sp.]|uniref:hypothetical protein n=1 Tax=Methylobacterium sp. TaxID=409 RepID=UPI0025DE2A87|nr:hypothetical protein [Methylobacterium sp.]MBX9933560.1 hypothetical protein [Methylobacterium sp.]